MNAIQPKVSVFMPVYNAGIYLKEAIESILNQTYTDFEFVIINDGSTDSSAEVIQGFDDSRIKLFNNNKNLGLIATLNIGLELCKGEYIIRMDSDDISLPNRIAHQIRFLEENPQIGLIGSWFEDFGDHIENKIVRYSQKDSEIRIRHLYQTHISHPTAVFRTSIIRENQIRFDPDFVYGEDYNFWVEMSAFCKMSNYPEVLVRKRDHPKNITNSFSAVMHDTCTKVKLKQFKLMGVLLDQKQADLYTRFADPEWGFNLQEMNQLLDLLVKIEGANRISNFIEVEAYSAYLSSKWYHLCSQNKNLGNSGWTWYNRIKFLKQFKPSLISEIRIKLRHFGLPL